MTMSYGSIAAAAPAPPSRLPPLGRLLAAFGAVGAWVVVAGAARSSRFRPTLAAAGAADAVSEPGYAVSRHPVSVDQALEACAALPPRPRRTRLPRGGHDDVVPPHAERVQVRGVRPGGLRHGDVPEHGDVALRSELRRRGRILRRGRVVRAVRWDAMVHFDAFCDGTWTPALPAAVGAVKDGDDDAAYAAAKALGADGGNDVDDPDALNKCDAKAFCLACGADDASAESCRAALAPGGEGGVAVLLNKGYFCGNDERA
ncbi:voltage-gated potassium channel [Aureococcus anophagefferens]|nr:voltage-gated potassium channel [Aureococcus anophagefferens]